jgi:hypothetical protein
VDLDDVVLVSPTGDCLDGDELGLAFGIGHGSP